MCDFCLHSERSHHGLGSNLISRCKTVLVAIQRMDSREQEWKLGDQLEAQVQAEQVAAWVRMVQWKQKWADASQWAARGPDLVHVEELKGGEKGKGRLVLSWAPAYFNDVKVATGRTRKEGCVSGCQDEGTTSFSNGVEKSSKIGAKKHLFDLATQRSLFRGRLEWTERSGDNTVEKLESER